MPIDKYIVLLERLTRKRVRLVEDEPLFVPRHVQNRHQDKIDAFYKQVKENKGIWEGDLNLRSLPITHLGDLKKVAGFLSLRNSSITSLGKLEIVEGELYLEDTPVTSLGRLEIVRGHLWLRNTPNLKWKDIPEELRDKVVGKINHVDESLFVPRHIDQRHEERLNQYKKMFILSDQLIVEWHPPHEPRYEDKDHAEYVESTLLYLNDYMYDFSQKCQIKYAGGQDYHKNPMLSYLWSFANLTPEKLDKFLGLCAKTFTYKSEAPYNLILETHAGIKVLLHELNPEPHEF